MTSLILESSSCKATLLVCHEGKVIEKFFFNGGSGLSQNFFLTLEKLALDWKSLSYIACGIGPGSFTGIRISAAIAQTLAFAHSIPLIPFCSLLAFTPKIEGQYFSAFDAKSFGIYLLKNDWKEAKAVSWEELPKYGCAQLYSPEAEGIRKRSTIPCIETDCNATFLASYCEKKFYNKEFSSSYLLPLTYLKVP